MKTIQIVLTAALFLAGGVTTAVAANKTKEPDPTAQKAWSADIFAGEGNFQSYCMGCHGVEGKGKGDGVLAESLDIKPRNLSDATFTSSKSDAHLFKVIKEGGVSVGLSENMTPFNEILSDQEIRKLVAYLRSGICRCQAKGQ
jgi:mono/diheme cytochrome c family protein